MVTIIWPDDTPSRPARTSAANYDELESKLRSEPWNPNDPAAFRSELAWRARLWSGKDVPTGGTSQDFLTALARTGSCKLLVTRPGPRS